MPKLLCRLSTALGLPDFAAPRNRPQLTSPAPCFQKARSRALSGAFSSLASSGSSSRTASASRRAASRRRTSASWATFSSGRPLWRVPKKSPGPRSSRSFCGEHEAVLRLDHRLQATLRVATGLVGEQDAVGLRRAAPDPAAELVQLRQAEAVGPLDQHDRRVRDVDADLDHGGRDEDVELAGRGRPPSPRPSPPASCARAAAPSAGRGRPPSAAARTPSVGGLAPRSAPTPRPAGR